MALTGGGTGGHIYPALAIGQALAKSAASAPIELLYFGNADGLEASLVPRAGVALQTVSSRPFIRSERLGLVRTAWVNAWGTLQAVRALFAFKPHIVIATGGYVCFPVIVAARLLRLLRLSHAPSALLEPNAQPGLTARLLAPLVDEIWAAHAATQSAFRKPIVVTGTPVRPEFTRALAPEDARRELGLDPSGTTIVVMGGSQGARSLNEAVAALVTRRSLPVQWQVLHVSGERDHAYMLAEERDLAVGNRVRLVPYLDDPSAAYAAADIMITRSGASTVAELMATATPALLVPYPHATDDHQRKNALALAGGGGARIIEDSALDGDALWWTLREMLADQTLGALREAAAHGAVRDAAATIVARITALVRRG